MFYVIQEVNLVRVWLMSSWPQFVTRIEAEPFFALLQ